MVATRAATIASSRLNNVVLSILAALLPIQFRDRQRHEWAADLMDIDNAGARRRYLIGAARTLPLLHRAIRRTNPTVDVSGAPTAPPTARILAVALILLVGSTVMLVAFGHRTGPLETQYELTGETDATAQPTVTSLDDNGKAQANILDAATVPWSHLLVINRGATRLEATPSKGTLTCQIIVEKKVVAQATGAPGQKVTCTAEVRESAATRLSEFLHHIPRTP